MHDDTDWFRGYVAGLEEALNILRYGGLIRSLDGAPPAGWGLLMVYLNEVKEKQCPWPRGSFVDGTR